METLYKEIHEGYNSGIIEIDNETVYELLLKLGPGISTIKVQVAESEYYKASPIVIVPLEVVPAYYIRFGQKNSVIDLIDPFVSAWGLVYNNDEEMIFESNYPHIIGSIWVEPFYNETGDELSIQDYIDITLDCTIYNDDGTTSTFPLKNEIMLRPGNWDGVMTFDIGLGPEDAFLMGLQCDLNLSFNIDFNKDQIYEDQRDVEIYLLDLRLEANPSSITSNTTWSIYDDGFSASEITVETIEETMEPQTGVLYLGGTQNGQDYGQSISFIFNNDTLEYGLDSASELLSLLALSDIVALKVVGIKDGDVYEFEQGTDWTMPYYPSGILSNDSFISFTGTNLPDEGSEFSVIYKLTFDFGINNYYGVVTLGFFNSYNESSVELQLPSGFLPVSNNSYSPMFIRFNQTCDGTTTEYTLDYGRQSAVVSDFMIYNEDELEALNNNNPVGKTIVNDHLKITFDQVPGSPFEVIYGVKSLYEVGYGFQKINKSYSDSVRLMYNEDPLSKILDESNNQLFSYDLKDPSLYISLDDSNETTILKLLNVPLLYAPEINITFKFDHVLLDLIDTFDDLFNNLTIEFKYITNDGFYEFYSDPIVIPLNYSEISLDIFDNSYSIYYSKDLQAIYDMVGVDNLDIEITLRQVGESNRFIPYIILEQYDYITDTHLVENYDRRPLDKYGYFDINAAVNTPHYYQAFTLPLVDCVYGDSPFDLIDGSEITIGLQNLPNATLVSVDSDGENYDFDFWGSSTTLPVNAENFYMIPNLGMFIDTYDIAEPLYQDGYLDLYYGSGTEIDGEEQYTTTIFMDYAGDWIADYQSFILDKTPTSWENTYDFADQFITTDIITVEGRVFYHQLFDLDIDINSSSVMNDIFPDYYKYINFGVELPQDLDIDEIRAIGDPYMYSLSIQGFPVGKYKEEYCSVKTYYSGSFDPIQDVLDDDDYALEYDENGTAYILFFKSVGELGSYTDAQKKIMIDYWVNYEFMQSYDYYIHEDPEDPYISQIEWDFSFIDEYSFRLHPDFNDETSFTVGYSALEWEIFNQLYIEDGIDIFAFQPKEFYNISVLYTGESSTDVFSIQYIVPEGQYKEDHLLFPSIYVLAQLGDDEDTIRVLEAFNDPTKTFIVQDAPDSYNYTIDFDEIESYIQSLYGPNYQLVKNSYLYVLAKYDSILLRYPMEHTPFNYEYLGEDHDAYHIALFIDGEFIAYSNETTFHDYVLKIENGYIYFNNKSQGQPGYIDPQSKIKLEYKFKLQPGLLDRKHFLIVTYPWINVFENSVLDPVNTEKYRKLSGGSIITPFEYSLSIDNKYSLYLSYRLNEREYFEEVFEISAEYFDSNKNGYVYKFMSQELDNYVDVLSIEGEDLINIYYFDRFNAMRFLDPSHYVVDIGSRQIIIKNDENALALQNSISRFYVSFIPESNDLEFASYHFSYDPTLKITEKLDMLYWDVIGLEGIDVIPNLNAYYFLNEKESSVNNNVCHASQLAVYLNEGNELEFNLEDELNNFDEGLLNAIHNGDYLSLYFDTNIKNIESLEYLSIELYDNQGKLSGFTQNITRFDLEMWDYNIKVNLPSTSNTLKKIRFVPIFRTDSEYNNDNTIGIARIQTAQWDSEFVSFMEDGQEYMHVDLEFDLKTELNGFELAYIFNDKLQYLNFLEDFSLNYTKDMDIYTLHIPAIYLDPDTNATVRFREEQTIVIRYNSPVKRGLALGIGKMYFEKKGYNYGSHPEISKAEFMLVEASSSDAYSEFTSDYYYQAPLQLTPFDTEYNNRFKTVKIDLNLTALYESTGSSLLNFTHLLFSVPNPSYELTINEVLIIEESSEPTTQSGSMDNRVWQYTEVELFTATKNPEQDSYQLTLENTPLFYPDSKWLDYLNIYDEDGNYYTAGLTGNDHQLHFEPSNNTFTWNPSFNQFPEYFGMEFEEPLIIEANKTLYFEYVVNTSWSEPIRIEVENIDLDSVRVIYDYNYLLKPEHYDWYIQNYNAAHSYENIAYSFKEEVEYRVVQYYYESFAVYSNISQYTHTFDIGDLSFEDDFVNLSLYKVIGLTPTFDSEILTDNDDYTIEFNETIKTLIITDWNITNGYLNVFDQITVILNYSYAPISSYSEIFLLDQFNQTYLANIEETFYTYVDIDYRFLTTTGMLFAESSTTIISDLTSFEAIDYCRNPDINDNNKLIGYGSELFDNFEIYQDESSIIYTSDIDMDREPDYKHTIDVNKDGKIDIIRYGIDDPQGSGEIYWHTVIQDFEGMEVNIKQEQPEELRTEWFDLDDRAFANYDFNVKKLIKIVLTLPFLTYHITKMILPDVDYWAQKSTQQLITREEHIKSDFYSVKVDQNRDGIPDSQVDYEKITVDVYYTVDEHRETILAAKRQSIFTYLAEYVASSFSSLFGGSKEDNVFNEKLTKEILESQDFTSCSSFTQKNAGVLRSTFRKITQNITTTYIDTFEQATMTIIDYNEEGDIEERRIYKDDFENYEVNVADKFFSGLAAEHLVTNIDTGQQYPVRFDPEIPFSHPVNISWDTTTWGPDQVPVKYDSLQVIGEDDSYTTNIFEENIILRIPNRYSLYHDYGKSSKANVVDNGWVEFEVSGLLITPQDGKVYYTSDMKSFISGRGKVDGHYFFVDSDHNGYYEMVYILSDVSTVSSSGIAIYDVMSIGYNYDGIHDFVPYERLNKKMRVTTNFNELAREKAKFGSDWVYNFRKLGSNDMLFKEESIWDQYKPKDQIFEIYKLVEPSAKNKKFSKLFYEIRHKSYSDAWKQYRKQLIRDIVEQVFMSVTAALLSAAVEALITAITLGFGASLAHAVGVLTYIATYTLMTKFFIDIKLHEAESRTRADTFYPTSGEVRKPKSLNEKSFFDRILGDGMAAALIGHPGGYYTTVSGGEPGNMYTAELLVSPPNLARMKKAFGGFLDLLWDNFWSMGESNPDVFTALDFDNKNLDYFLLTSELPSYNHKDYYTYENTNGLLDEYDLYYANTLGYLETKVRRSSDNLLDMIRPTCIDGRPHYEFINSTQFGGVLPQSVLFNPIVLSEQWYNQIQPDLGHLVVQVKCLECTDSSEINPYGLGSIETQLGYKAKIPINDNGFGYPIDHISIDVVRDHPGDGVSYFAQDLVVNETYYTVDSGNLYFNMPVEDIVSEKYQLFDDVLQEIRIGKFADSDIYYNVHIYFDVFVPDTTEDTHNLALAQATLYSIMDYSNQYTYAEISANMISEIAYTETLTFWSTLISVPLVYFGSLAVSSTVGKMFGEAGLQAVKTSMQIFSRPLSQVLVSFATAPIQEMFEEIIHDAFIEAFAEGFADIVGWSEDVGFWLSSLGTSYREVKGALGEIVLGKGRTDLKTTISVLKAKKAGDMSMIVELQQKINQELQQQQALNLQKQQEIDTWQKLLISNFFKGFLMLAPALFFGTFDLFALSGFKRTVGGIQSYVEYRSRAQAYKKDRLQQSIGNIAPFYQNLQEQMKKPAGINEGALHTIFREMQETGIIDSPPVDISILFNPNPIHDQRPEIFYKLKEISLANDLKDIDFAVETFTMLYPEGYAGFHDPLLGLQQWGMDKDLDISHLSFWGGLEGRKNEIEGNQRALDRFDDFDPAFEGIPMFPTFSSGKLTTINDFLTNDLQLTDRILDYNIYVNGKEVDLDFWSDFEIYPDDMIMIGPYMGVLEEVYNIENKILSEVDKDYVDQELCTSGTNPLLSSVEREILYEFYKRQGEPPYKKSNWQSRTISSYTVHFKFLIDESIRILNEHTKLTVDVKYLSTLVTESGQGRNVKDAFYELRRGDKFDLTEDYLLTWYAGMWYGIEKAYDRGDILSAEDKNIALYELDKLFKAQYNIYDVGKPSKVYLPLRQAYQKLRKVIYDNTNICPDGSLNTFGSTFSFSPAWYCEHTYNRPGFVPFKSHWQSLGSNIISKLESESLDYLIPIITSIINEIADIIENADSPLKNKPNWAKTELLEMIIDCPDTDILKRITRDSYFKDLSFILFNHPNYGYSAGKKDNYLSSVYFMSEKWNPSTINALLHRISTLTTDDFDFIGLGDRINDIILNKLKEHAKNAVYKWIEKYGLISYEGVGRSYHTKELRDLQFKTFRALWEAAAYYKGEFFISSAEMSRIYGISESFYTTYITRSGIITNNEVMRILKRLDDFLIEESSSIITPNRPLSYASIINDPTSSWISTKRSLAYFEARENLLELEVRKQEAIDTRMKSGTVGKTWYDNLFAPTLEGYASGWDSPLYMAFSVIMDLLEVGSTELISGIPIPDAAFNIDHQDYKFQRHHKGSKLSLALFDQILTIREFGLHAVYESMSESQQDILKRGMRELWLTGIFKPESQARSGSDLDLFWDYNSYLYSEHNIKQWVTLEDFKKVFPTTLKFTFAFKGKTHTCNLLEAWEVTFGGIGGFGGFDDKLFFLNEKIQTFRDSLKKGGNPYKDWLETHHPIAEERFLENAIIFSSQLIRLMDNSLFTGLYSNKDLINRWHIYLMKRSFEI